MGLNLSTSKMSSILNAERIAIGTAQFGMNYGIANQAGQVSLTEAANILGTAATAGLDTLDTAISYGDSEARLGQIGIDQWHTISKLQQLPDRPLNVSTWVRASVTGSLERLNVPSLGGLLLHHPSDLLGERGKALYAALVELKTLGLVKKIGISIYQPDELDTLLKHMYFDVVQAPLNIFDQRMLDSGWLARLHNLGIEVHVRSVFMQGLLAMPAIHRPAKFQRWQPLWDRWESWLDIHQLTRIEACLRFVMSFDEVRRVIVGVDTIGHFQEILTATSGDFPPRPVELRSTDLALLNPSNWYQL
jgi:aryl-alcohol dehydrogenase-like predicted oxidoreductase